jgi:hypothetical protein
MATIGSTRRMPLSSLAWAMPLIALGSAAQVRAAGPGDPFSAPALQARSATGASAADAPAGTDPALNAQPRPSGLTGVRIGRHSAALIDDRWIALGQPVGNAVLLRVTIDGATLRHADGRIERLTLNPGIELQRLVAHARPGAGPSR